RGYRNDRGGNEQRVIERSGTTESAADRPQHRLGRADRIVPRQWSPAVRRRGRCAYAGTGWIGGAAGAARIHGPPPALGLRLQAISLRGAPFPSWSSLEA